MTEQAGDQADGPAQWASSAAGRAAVDAASGKLAEIDPDGDWQISEEYLAAVVHAAHAAYTDVLAGSEPEDPPDDAAVVYAAHAAYQEALAGSEPEDPPAAGDGLAGHEHDWRVLGVQEAPPEFTVLGKPVPRTAVLTRCAGCGEPRAWLLPGTWTQADFGDPLFRR